MYDPKSSYLGIAATHSQTVPQVFRPKASQDLIGSSSFARDIGVFCQICDYDKIAECDGTLLLSSHGCVAATDAFFQPFSSDKSQRVA